MQTLPNDPCMLLSVVNLKLRDYYNSLEALCEDLECSKDDIEKKLSAINYRYDEERNQFV